ncbi:YqhV family protein [Peribacillus asahii]|uniref:Uncharacterized protein n=1 Tax=Peribacillus asahii TaxID=228899 RepID=A0A3Q9RQB1_9BACI|nr:YqhV family protein [Peribacillus asahii]AZV43888.1 hypothetical protein BAOM_3279 [Peribacillus asahii]USK68775.1 YqhV family protein [Peribacillus asahii]USK83639.1 YqhV family protein [Peribacillus asahii]
MFTVIEKAVLIMGTLRFLSASIEMVAAMLIFKLNDIEKALIINSSLAMVGPIILVVTTTVGLIGVAEKLSLFKISCIFLGVVLILVGIKSR